MMRKRWIALLLAAVLCVGLLPVAAGAEESNLPTYGFYTAQNRSEETYTTSISYVDLADGAVWLLCENGFTQDELASVTVTANTTEMLITEAVRRDGSDGRYDLKIQLPEMTGGSSMYLEATDNAKFSVPCSVRYAIGNVAQVGGYVIGFGDPTGDPIEIFKPDASFGRWTMALPNPDNPRGERMSLGVYAGIEKEEGGFQYIEAVTNPEDIRLSIESMWIEPLDCDEGTFSWTQEGDVLVKSEGFADNIGTLYLKDGYAGYARIWASVKVQCGGTTDTVQVSVVGSVKRYGVEVLKRGTDDTVDKLNTALADWAEELEKNGGTGSVECCVLLAENANYEGTIVIPKTFENERYILSIQGQEGTVLTGGIDLNRCMGLHMVNHLEFRAPATANFEEETKALFNGTCAYAYGCTFSGYDMALDVSEYGMINVAHSVFVNNEIAARVDIENLSSTSMNPWTDNLFVDNGIAVQVLSLNEFLSPYYFRVVDSSFINNKTDFDVRCGGTVYFYRNYYGQSTTHEAELVAALRGLQSAQTAEALLTYGTAKIHTENGTRVIVNPRWKLPVMTWAGEIFLQGNYLTADWKNPTEIVNEEAQNLLIDASAFETDEEDKKIDVVDENSENLGTWTFD